MQHGPETTWNQSKYVYLLERLENTMQVQMEIESANKAQYRGCVRSEFRSQCFGCWEDKGGICLNCRAKIIRITVFEGQPLLPHLMIKSI